MKLSKCVKINELPKLPNYQSIIKLPNYRNFSTCIILTFHNKYEY